MVPIGDCREQSSIPLDSLMSRKGISVAFNWFIHERTLADCAGRLVLRSALSDFGNPSLNKIAFQAPECPIFKPLHWQASRAPISFCGDHFRQAGIK